MSFALQPLRKRQSFQATNTLPRLSISAEGSGSARMLPATPWSVCDATATDAFQLVPPFVEVKYLTPLKSAVYGTTTVPFFLTTGCPPSPCALSAVDFFAPQVRPPSVEVFIS